MTSPQHQDSETRIVTADGVALAGSFRCPESPRGVVVMAHGITVDRHEFLGFYDDIAAQLAELGLASIRFDFRGHGCSEGAEVDFSIVSQLIDMVAVKSWLDGRSDVAGLPRHYLGTSFGAFPAAWAASREEVGPSRVFLLAPVLDYRRVFLQPESEWAQESFHASSIATAMESGSLLLDESFRVSLRLILEMGLVDPMPVLRRVAATAQVVHGASDSMVPIDTTRTIASAAGLRLRIVSGMDHGFVAEGDEAGTSPASIKFRTDLVSSIAEFLSATRSPIPQQKPAQ